MVSTHFVVVRHYQQVICTCCQPLYVQKKHLHLDSLCCQIGQNWNATWCPNYLHLVDFQFLWANTVQWRYFSTQHMVQAIELTLARDIG